MYINIIESSLDEIEMKIKPFKPRPYIDVIVQGSFTLPSLYDTGADITCMNEQTFRRISVDKRPVKLSQVKRRISSASDNQLVVLGTYKMKLRMLGKEIEHPVVVMKNLRENLIVGMDFIHNNKLFFNPQHVTFCWDAQGHWQQGHLKVRDQVKIAPLTAMAIKVQMVAESGSLPGPNQMCLANVGASSNPLLTGGPYLLQADETGQSSLLVHNCSPEEVTLERNDFIGQIENITGCEMKEVNPDYIQKKSELLKQSKQAVPLEEKKKKFIQDSFTSEIEDENIKKKYLDLVLKHHEAVSRDRFDLGRTKTLMHEISLKTDEPVYVKQFKIPDAHQEEVERHVTEWLKLGVIQPARSKYNSPIFAVMKKNGGVRLVQDFRALNAQSHIDKYSMKDISECIGEIGKANSTIFSTLDLTGGFWQMLLHPKSRPFTAFTVPGQGQFQWVTSPMGLLGCPASFQRLMETVVKGIDNVVVYIDDLLLHSDSHDRQLQLLDQLLERLVLHNIKLNLPKCVFGSQNVSYLGFRLTAEGIKPGTDKLKAVEKADPPTNVHEVRQFLGLCNFFRTHVKNFAMVTAPLTKLTRKDCDWKGGPLPEDALKAFKELQSILVSEPVMAYPRKNRTYSLIVDAALGDCKKPGGLGAILTQLDEHGEHQVIAYASRKLQQHEKNYTPYLIEQQACIWGIEHFSTYLIGRPFVLFTDHKPLEKLGVVHTKTLNRLQQLMLKYNFETVHKKGSEMPADFLSRNVVNSIEISEQNFREEQLKDPAIQAIVKFILNGEVPVGEGDQRVVRFMANDCFVEDGILWRRMKRQFEPSRVVLYTPKTMRSDLVKEAHGTIMSGHDGVLKTKERLLQSYYWPGMDQDIQEHIKSCHQCQVRKTQPTAAPTLLSSLPATTEPNQRIHADLFGPLATSGRNKKYLLCMTDAFTKYVELVAIEDKEAPTVANAIFEKWFCRYGIPLDIVTDRGSEFCAKLSEELFKQMGTNHLKTAPYHPQTNSQAEVANKTIQKYLNSFTDDKTMDWELYVAPMMFSYNTSFHRTVLNTPHFLNFGVEPRQPAFIPADLRRKFYGEDSTTEILQRLLYARKVAQENNEVAADKAKEYFDQKAQPHQFQPNQLVLLRQHNFLGVNTKLAAKWTGPHRIIRLKGPHNAEIKLCHNHRTMIVNVAHLKAYFTPRTDRPEVEDLQRKEKGETEKEKKNEPLLPLSPLLPPPPPPSKNIPTPPPLPPIEEEEEGEFIEPDFTPRPRLIMPQIRRNGNQEPSTPRYWLRGTPTMPATPSAASSSSSAPSSASSSATRTEPVFIFPPAQEGGGIQVIADQSTTEKLINAIYNRKAINVNEINEEDAKEGWVMVTHKKKRLKKQLTEEELIKGLINADKRGIINYKWTPQQWKNYIHTGDPELSRPYEGPYITIRETLYQPNQHYVAPAAPVPQDQPDPPIQPDQPPPAEEEEEALTDSEDDRLIIDTDQSSQDSDKTITSDSESSCDTTENDPPSRGASTCSSDSFLSANGSPPPSPTSGTHSPPKSPIPSTSGSSAPTIVEASHKEISAKDSVKAFFTGKNPVAVTRARLIKEGVLLPNEILHIYPADFKRKKK